MDLNILTRDADDLIRKVVSRYNSLYIPAGKISQVELDLILDDLRKLYDTFKTISHVNIALQNNIPKPEVLVKPAVQTTVEPVAATPLYTEQIVQEVKQTSPAPNPEPEMSTEAVSPVYEEIRQEFETGKEQKSEPVSNPLPETPIKTAFQSINPEPTTLADKFTTGSKSLSESLAGMQTQNAIASKLNNHPIADLLTGISLNDKFSFITELFRNNPAQYEEAITRINKAVNVDEANWILQKYHTPEWDQQQETHHRLKDFVKRRFV